MILLLDGYNILKQIFNHTTISETERNAFVRLLGRYTEKKHHKIIIFFDGGPYIKPFQERLHKIAVWYSGHPLTADDLIIEQAPLYKGKDACLVTSDRALINTTKPFIKTVFEPLFFYGQIKETCAPAPTTHEPLSLIKTSSDVNPELDALMREAAGLPMHNKEELHQERTPSASLSKKDRIFRAKKGKL